MDFLSSLNISGSGLTAQKLRMDVISQNIANAEVTNERRCVRGDRSDLCHPKALYQPTPARRLDGAERQPG